MRIVAFLAVAAAVLLGCDEQKPRPVDDCGSGCADAGVIVDARASGDGAADAAPDADASDLDAGDGGDA